MKRRSPTWFFFALLTSLFVMSMLAPLAWNRARPLPAESDHVTLADEPADLPPTTPPPQARRLPAVEPELVLDEPELEPPLPPVADQVQPEMEAMDPAPAAAPEEPVAPEPPSPAPPPQAEPAPVSPSSWLPRPEALLSQLDGLSKVPSAARWAGQVRQQIEKLMQCGAADQQRASELIADLQKSSAAAEPLTASVRQEQLRSDIRRTAAALSRRLALWSAANTPTATVAADRNKQRNTDEEEEARGLGRRLANLLSRGEGRHHERPRAVADAIEPTPRRAKDEHHILATASSGSTPNEIVGLLGQIERYEKSRSVSDARFVTASLRTLAASPDVAIRKLAVQTMETYNGPNLRISATQQLANRLLPQPHTMETEVNDWIVGARVYGQNTIFTKLSTHFVPDPRRLHILMVADGVVDSQTSAYSGPAAFENEGQTSFEVYRGITISPDGVRQRDVVAEANAQSDVVGVSTDYDWIPFFAALARSRALKEQRQQHCAALSEVEEKVSDEAKRRFEEQLNPKVRDGVAAFQKKIWQPLKRLNLNPTPVEMSTTVERMVSRVLVAGDGQLAAHTPRPRVPSDSLTSLQIHESLLNNGLAQLKLDGQTMSLPELYRRISKELLGEVKQAPETLPGNVRIRFAAQDSVQVRFNDGKVQLVLTLDEVRKAGDEWQNLVVTAYYAPEGKGLDARLVRTEFIELKGQQLNAASQIALRGAFSKLLSRSRTVPLIPQQLVEDQRLRDSEVTQFEVRDGWIAVAIGPRDVAQRTALKGQEGLPRWRLTQ